MTRPHPHPLPIIHTGGGEQGTVSSSQCTRRLSLALTLLAESWTQGPIPHSVHQMTEAHRAKMALLSLAATVSGCTVRTSDRNTAFSRNRWIPCSLKCNILNSLGCPAQAGLDLLGGRPDLQDLFLDPESESGGSESLPHPHSALGRLITMAALMIARTALQGAVTGAGAGQGEYRMEDRDRKGVLEGLQAARKLADIAGRDDIVCAILIFIPQIDAEEKTTCTDMMKTVLSTVRTDGDCPDPVLTMAIMGHLEGNQSATKYFKSLLLPPSVHSFSYITEEEEKEVQKWMKKLHCSMYLRDKIVVRTLGGSGRRTFLLNSKNGQKNSPRPVTVTTAIASTGEYSLLLTIYPHILSTFSVFSTLVYPLHYLSSYTLYTLYLYTLCSWCQCATALQIAILTCIDSPFHPYPYCHPQSPTSYSLPSSPLTSSCSLPTSPFVPSLTLSHFLSPYLVPLSPPFLTLRPLPPSLPLPHSRSSVWL